MKPNRQNGREWRVFHDSLKGASGDRTGWLGWKDSNFHMAELKHSEPPLRYQPLPAVRTDVVAGASEESKRPGG